MEKFKASIILKLNKLKHKREIYVKLLKVKKENEKLGNLKQYHLNKLMFFHQSLIA